ncbi:MAG: response regulator transcription factor [Ruminococcus sp.]|jgi:two-component system response regulator YesN|nr:response regulator transcription factor [Ruminococcus sp.]
MLRVLIVDDEQNVRSGLIMLIPWEEAGCEVIGEASDGDEGLEMIMGLSPDIVIADIRMPGITGIEMLTRAKIRGYTGKSIILSGYSDFSYARDAITVGVKKFILKPVDEDEVLETLKELAAEIAEEREHQKLIQKNSAVIAENFIKQILEGKADLSEAAKFSELQANSYSAALIQAGSSENSERIAEILGAKTGVHPLKMDLAGNVAVLLCDLSESQAVSNLEEIALENDETEGCYTVLGKTVHSLFEVKDSFTEAQKLFSLQFLLDGRGVVTSARTALPDPANTPEPVCDTTATINKIAAFIEINNTEKISETIEQLHSNLLTGHYSPENVKLICIGGMKEIIKKITTTSEKKEGIPDDSVIDNIGNLSCLKDIITEMDNILCRISDSVFGNTTKSNIEKVIRYIEDNYTAELRLEGLATLFGYNSAYLGKVFSRHTGDNFNNYLDRIRISEAKRLLESGELKVYEVAKSVGFQNINYFHNKFKKLVGVSPLSYQKTEARGQMTE